MVWNFQWRDLFKIVHLFKISQSVRISQSETSMQNLQVSAENAGKFMFLQFDHQKGLFFFFKDVNQN